MRLCRRLHRVCLRHHLASTAPLLLVLHHVSLSIALTDSATVIATSTTWPRHLSSPLFHRATSIEPHPSSPIPQQNPPHPCVSSRPPHYPLGAASPSLTQPFPCRPSSLSSSSLILGMPIADASSHFSRLSELKLMASALPFGCYCDCHVQIAPPLVFKRVRRFWNSDSDTTNQRPAFVNMQLQANRASTPNPTPIHTSDNKIPHVLAVAGSDSGAGAGIQADLKACAARRVYCSTVITAVTAQNTLGVQGVNKVPEDFVATQLDSVLSDMHVDVVKTGMLPSLSMVKVLCRSLRKFPVKALVVDPVMISTSGDILAGPSVLAGFREELLPMADIVTPNIKEASVLLGDVPMKSVSDMRAAAKLIHDLGPRNVLVKGGDLPNSSDAIDIFFDGEEFYELCSPRVNTCNTHGTGCTLASCIAAELAKGSSMLSAVKIAKRFVETALDYSRDLVIGNGAQGPFDHFLALKNINQSSCRQDRFNPNDLLLYAVTDSGMNRKWGRSIAEAVKAAVEGGATIVQLREKDAETREFVDAAKVCLKICRSYGVPLLINDRVDVALACDADGVHVGQSDMPARLVRTLLGPDKIIGVSCKTPEQAEQAWIDGADYIGSGGVYPTNTKANNHTIGLDGLREVCKASKLPVVAIGGIGLSNARAVMEIGVPSLKGVAVVSALFDRESILTETRNLHVMISEHAMISEAAAAALLIQ